jgi:hypothetical protein
MCFREALRSPLTGDEGLGNRYELVAVIAGRTSLPDSAILTAVFTSYLEEFYSETQKDVKTYGEGQGNCKTARWLPPFSRKAASQGL